MLRRYRRNFPVLFAGGFPPLALVSPAEGALTQGTVATAYTATDPIVIDGGSGSFSFGATGLPSGMSIASDTGVISGTPATPLTSGAIDVTVTDTVSGQTLELEYTLTIAVNYVTQQSFDAPLSGDWKEIDIESVVSVSGGQAVFASQATSPVWGEAAIYYDVALDPTTLARAFVFQVNYSSINFFLLGWFGIATGSPANTLLTLYGASPTVVFVFSNPAAMQTLLAHTTGVNYKFALIASGNRMYTYLLIGGNWTLLAVVANTDTSIFAILSNYQSAFTAQFAHIINLLTSTLISPVLYSGTVSDGVTDNAPHADSGHWFTMTKPTSGTREYIFRKVSGTQCWVLSVNTSGDMNLIERNSGDTVRGTFAAGVATDTVIFLHTQDEAIQVYIAKTRRISYASAANFKTATGVEIPAATGGNIKDLAIREIVAPSDIKLNLDALM